MTAKTHKKLIEVALPLSEINDASAYDKMPGIGPHPKGIHHWWARLPLPTARAILFASVVDDPEAHPELWSTEEEQKVERERLFSILRRMMGKKLHEAPEVYAEACNEMLKHCNGILPAVFDPFSGGGSIPLEANRLGFEAYASDLNPVAVLLNKCNLEIAPRWRDCPPVNPVDRERIGGADAWRGNDGLASDIKYYASAVRAKALAAIGSLYPKVALPTENGGGSADVIAWIWSRTVASPNPAAKGIHVPLASTFVLSSKKDNEVITEIVRGHDDAFDWNFRVFPRTPDSDQLKAAKTGTKAGKAQDFICAITGTPIQRSYIQVEGKAGRLSARLQAIVADGPRGRVYVCPNSEHTKAAHYGASAKDIKDARETFLAGPLPTRAEITGGVCTAYGLNTWGHLYSDRQIFALLTLGDLTQEVRSQVHIDAIARGMNDDQARDYASAITTFLSLAVDRCADFNNTLCRWSPSNQKVMNLFGKQALPMVFDYAEANILGESVGAWKTCVEYVADCIRTIATRSNGEGPAKQIDAASGTNGARNLLISTDPPYYNNISYATLSDFFYVWLRRNIGEQYPEIFGTVLAPKMPELIAAANRFGGDQVKAKEHFEEGFKRAFTSLRGRMDHRFPLTVYYAFKQEDEAVGGEGDDGAAPVVDLTTGWETLLEALMSSGFQITGTWPVRASQKWRMVSMGTNALASYIVLVCRPRPDDAPHISRNQFRNELRRSLPGALRHLQQGNIAPVDLAQAAIGPGMSVYTRYGKVLDVEGKSVSVREALTLINQTLGETLTEQEGDFDSATRWALSWFEQNGFAEGEYGEAEILSKAKNTSVTVLADVRILEARRGKVRLFKPEELQAKWMPTAEADLTAWEVLHHLIRRLGSGGEKAAADLVVKLGARADIARELAYRLYTISERKKRASEALAYNGLVQSWSEINRLAHEGGPKRPVQKGLFEEAET
jgi:putative DNA methylase